MEISVLGPLRVTVRDRVIPLPAKQQILLAVLALQPNATVSNDRLMVALWGEDVKAEGTSRVTWEITPVGDSCCLTVTHDQQREGANNQLYGGWPMLLSGLKTWLETGELLTTPGSLMYAGS